MQKLYVVTYNYQQHWSLMITEQVAFMTLEDYFKNANTYWIDVYLDILMF